VAASEPVQRFGNSTDVVVNISKTGAVRGDCFRFYKTTGAGKLTINDGDGALIKEFAANHGGFLDVVWDSEVSDWSMVAWNDWT
jgi:hypothetical protein